MTPEEIQKRKQVMGRSIKLGHCVCDPAKPCPCPLFQERNVCLCAGEHLPVDDAVPVNLTEHVRSAGCASKIGQKDLDIVLSKLPQTTDPRLVVGASTGDDAGVFEIRPGLLLVQTVDVFTPGVDDPYTFGRIAACNSLSDVYAMGGTPVTALSIIGFPIHTLPHRAMREILKGGLDTLAEAGALCVGGHSVNDEEVKFGMAVTGVVERDRLATNAGAEEGDVLILTKALGIGMIALAGQLGRATPASQAAAAESMTTLNRAASEAMIRHGAKACTDVTGFGLLGHLTRMMLESGTGAEIDFDALPLLPDVMAYAEAGIYSGANERNSAFVEPHVAFDPRLSPAQQAVLYDAQTSGGLLIPIRADAADALLRDLHATGVPAARAIGRVTAPGTPRIVVK
ncbi:MAG: selenide, water dikinase SelD [Kiritimatiellia bacterium]|jgi:selenide,water dikinase